MKTTGYEELQFDVDSFLDDREQQSQRVVVEFGHRAEPILVRNPEFFTNRRMYVGIEANLRDPLGVVVQDIKNIKEKHKDSNAAFLDHDTGAIPLREGEENSTELEGEYRVGTVLPTGAADEVFIGNVFGDPHIAYDREKTEALVAELGRLLLPEGLGVIRETTTPQRVYYLTDAACLWYGLKILGVLYKPTETGAQEDKEIWDRLEAIYGTENCQMWSSKESFYMFLGTLATTD